MKDKLIRPDDPGGNTLKLAVLLAGIVVLILGSCILDAIIQNTILTTKHKSINAPTNVIFIYASTLNRNS